MSQDNTKTYNRYSQEDTLETYETRERDQSIRKSLIRDRPVTESQRVPTGLSGNSMIYSLIYLYKI